MKYDIFVLPREYGSDKMYHGKRSITNIYSYIGADFAENRPIAQRMQIKGIFMIDKLQVLFHTYKEPVFGIKGRKIVFLNAAAEKLVNKIEIGCGGDTVFPDEVLDRCGQEFAGSCEIVGEPMDVVGSAIDGIGILRLYAKESLSASAAAVLDGINRQMRQSLSVLSIAAGFLADSIDRNGKRDMEENISIVLHSYYKLARLSDNITYFTEQPDNSDTLNLQNTDIITLIRDMTSTIRSLIDNIGVSLVFEGSAEPYIVAIDRAKFTRLLLNLISNSLKYTDAGGTVTISLEIIRDKIVVGVKDTGRGMPPNVLYSGMDRFSADKDLSDTASGLGLGLPTASEIARMHGGMVLIESREDVGTTVMVTIPDKELESGTLRESRQASDDGIHAIYKELSDVLPSEAYSTKFLD